MALASDASDTPDGSDGRVGALTTSAGGGATLTGAGAAAFGAGATISGACVTVSFLTLGAPAGRAAVGAGAAEGAGAAAGGVAADERAFVVAFGDATAGVFGGAAAGVFGDAAFGEANTDVVGAAALGPTFNVDDGVALGDAVVTGSATDDTTAVVSATGDGALFRVASHAATEMTIRVPPPTRTPREDERDSATPELMLEGVARGDAEASVIGAAGANGSGGASAGADATTSGASGNSIVLTDVVTVTRTNAKLPSTVAVIVAAPSLSAASVPRSSTNAIVGASECHVT